MVDPLSISASAAGLLSLGLQSTEYLYNFYKAYKSRHEDLTDITTNLLLVLTFLQNLSDLLKNRTWRLGEAGIKQSIEEILTRNKEVIAALQSEAEKFKVEPKDTWKEKAVKIGRNAAYPFKHRTIGGLKDNVCELSDDLALALQALDLKEHQNTQDDVREVFAIINGLQAFVINTSQRQWLGAPDPTVDFNAASAKRHPGTGSWLVTGTAYKSWLSQDNSFLWLYGFAGCGKTVLFSTAVQDAFRHRQTCTNSAVAFFFFNFRDASKQSASSALRALLLQLCGQVAGLESDLARLKETSNHATPSIQVLLDYLRQTITRCEHVYILLDALDESPAGLLRKEVLKIVREIRSWQLHGLHLLLTSRDEPDIRIAVSHPAMVCNANFVALKSNGVQEDIAHFVSNVVDTDDGLEGFTVSQRKLMKDHLISHAGGVFRWVDCQLQALRECSRSSKHLEQCLRTLPEDLDETYERMLCGLKLQSDARWMLAVLCVAERAITVAEMTEALAVNLDETDVYDPDRRLNGSPKELERICPGLIEIIASKSAANVHGMAGSEVVRIAHFSVQEYLLSDRIMESKAKYFGFSLPREQGRIGKMCIVYLQHNDFLNQRLTRTLVRQHALAVYAATFWYVHYKAASGVLPEGLSTCIAAFLMDQERKERWVLLHDPEKLCSSVEYSTPKKCLLSPIYYAALLGLATILGHLLENKGADVNAQGGQYGNALQAAAVNGSEQVVALLLAHGADVNARGGHYGNALQVAAVNSTKKVVEILLAQGANVNTQGGYYGNALQAAAVNGSEQVVMMLLAQGANVNAQGGFYGNALQMAVVNGSKQVVMVLLAHGANINAQHGYFGNALQAAVFKGSEQVVTVLLAQGANVNTQGGFYGNALQAAADNSSEQVVALLLAHSADVNAQGGRYGNALQVAAVNSFKQVVKVLLAQGANVNTQGGEHGNTLQAAAFKGSKQVVTVLLAQGADVNTQGGFYGNALQVAVFKGSEQVVTVLLAHSANINAQGGHYGNALQVAACKGSKQVVTVLLAQGADVNAQGGVYNNAL